MSIKKYGIPVLLAQAHQGAQNRPKGWKFVRFCCLASENGGTIQMCVIGSKIIEIMREKVGE